MLNGVARKDKAMSKIYDNIGDNKFLDGLHGIVCAPGVVRADFCVGYFNLRGWRSIANEVNDLVGGEVKERMFSGGKDQWCDVERKCRLLIGMCRPMQDVIHEIYAVNVQKVDDERAKSWKRSACADFRRQLTIGVPTKEDELALRMLRNQLANGIVAVKLHLRFPLHAKLYLAHRPGDPTPAIAIMGSSNLTVGGLSKNGELNAEFADVGDTSIYDKWFNDRWNDRFSVDVTEDIVKIIDESWATEKGYTPYEVYLKIMYHLSREARSGVTEYRLPEPFDNELFEYQQTAVKLAVRHLEKRRGAMIGDVVGLGKTITACAVAKFYEWTHGASTLILCPAKLTEMWEGYAKRYNLKTQIRSIDKKFDPSKEYHYHLVIIDESQNLRNSEGRRYSRIKDLLDTQSGCKVLLLTATPYNKDYSDIASQLGLFVDREADLGIRPEAYIASLGGESDFVVRHPNTLMTSLGAFEKSEWVDDWRDLMKLFLVRRTRTFIKKNYAKQDENGYYLELKGGERNYFPTRKPVSITFPTAQGDQFEKMYSEAMVETMDKLKLPRYGLQKYIDALSAAKADAAEKQILDNLSRAGRRLMGFRKSNFYKRMDSSGIVFLMSLYRHAVRNAMFLYAIDNGKDLPIRAADDIEDEYSELEGSLGEVVFVFPTQFKDYEKAGEDAYKKVAADAGESVDWISPTFFKKTLRRDLKAEVDDIIKIFGVCGEWKPAQDEKLNRLYELLTKKHPNEKVLVFSQYSDTARYVGKQLKDRGLLNVAVVDGGTEDVVAQAMLFSPKSNHAPTPIPIEKQTRVLVATDMLSEGQNLQDAHIVVNFDLPWAIIRLIQRAGRVDRIGQSSKTVFCYSFFPQDGIEKLINLRNRLNRRINENAGVIGSDEVFFEGNETNLRDLFSEKSGVLDDEEDDGEVDLSSQAYQVWDFATKNNKALAERIQSLADVIYSTKGAERNDRGVITYAKTKSDTDVLVWLDEKGGTKSTSPVKIFKALEAAPDTPRLEPLLNHHELVRNALVKVASSAGNMVNGVLGSPTSIKRRLFTMMQTRLKENLMPLFEQGIKEAANAVYNYPIRESARSQLQRMFQQKRKADDILEVALDLYKDGLLCIIPDESEGGSVHAAKIICSMGLK